MTYNVRYLGFNQQMSCFTCVMESEVRLYNVEPLAEKSRLDVDAIGSVSLVALYDRSNLLAVVSGGENPMFPSNIVKIWDEMRKKFVCKYTFVTNVLNVKFSKYKIVVVLKNSCYVFMFPSNSKLLTKVDTKLNPLGLCQVSHASDHQMLVTLGHECGDIQFTDLSKSTEKGSDNSKFISAHKSDIACLAINHRGTLIATASEKGTLIRLFDTQSRVKLTELRRGTEYAVVYSINFNKDSSYLCAASDKGTVHMFAIKNSALNKRSAFATVGQVLPFQEYTNSQWSFCFFPIPFNCFCQCVFGVNNCVVVVCADGTYHKYSFNSDGVYKRVAYDFYLGQVDEIDIL